MKSYELIAIFLNLLVCEVFDARAQDATPIAQQAYIKASNSGAGDWFGGAVAISGDTMVVGGFFESSNAIGGYGNQNNNSAPKPGAAIWVVRNRTNRSQHACLKASN